MRDDATFDGDDNTHIIMSEGWILFHDDDGRSRPWDLGGCTS